VDPRIKRLEKEAHFSPLHAHAYVESEGNCVFCGFDLIDTPQRYSMGTIDHLLPRSRYEHLADHKANHVLSCLRCNGLKSGFCGLEPGEDAEDMLEHHRDVLISRAVSYLEAAVPRLNGEWSQAKEILRDKRH